VDEDDEDEDDEDDEDDEATAAGGVTWLFPMHVFSWFVIAEPLQ
jgi:hypothetical protein